MEFFSKKEDSVTQQCLLLVRNLLIILFDSAWFDILIDRMVKGYEEKFDEKFMSSSSSEGVGRRMKPPTQGMNGIFSA